MKNFSAPDIALCRCRRVRLLPVRRRRPAAAAAASGCPLAPAHLPLRLRLHLGRERRRDGGREQPPGRRQQAGQVGHPGVRASGRGLCSGRSGFAQEPDGRGQLERDADALRCQADFEEQARRGNLQIPVCLK